MNISKPSASMNENFALYSRNVAGFIGGFLKKPHFAGSVPPVSTALANTMSEAALRYGKRDAFVIEVEAGTGVMTKILSGAVADANRFMACEQNVNLAQALQQRLPYIPLYQGQIQHWHGWHNAQAKTIVSSLPFGRLAKDEALTISACFQQELIANSASILVQVGYGLRNPIAELAANPLIVAFGHRIVLRNLPPAKVWVYRSLVKANWARTPLPCVAS